ncbi:diacylglycerol kinase family enzyme [Fusobacterium naviforme]|uniref:Diacylglycerol kinase family enzyme n=1 Tax=Moryella indoligenes TaxID=371674 RepID=A0AAE3V937_9FIRM|nr:diacylglycerol kinase family protein [Moryella indoligenes]KAB0578765.1 diacylglycerol kinase family lipid kinase [Fusobacterium naviforme]MDQ0151986.1 diacylglycerol kinase family enzyme [Moryella indoligenes]PSL11534.1 diacylglycerol kinase family enzyme [Fusobacterium naviforme]STO26615.1 Putative lipid kinase YtlR [Fusobacterium naviforme]
MLTFIVNPNSGGEKGYRSWKKLERHLIKKNIAYQVFLTGCRGEARELAARLTETVPESGDVLVAVGGDGTMNEVLDGVHLSEELVLGFIPTGRGSDLKRGLRLPRTQRACLKRILSPRELRLMDYGVVDYGGERPEHRRFAVSCGSGFDAALTEDFRTFSLRHCTCGCLRAAAARTALFLRCLIQGRTVKGYLLLDGVRRVELNHIFLFSAQIQPTEAGGLRLAPRVSNADGELTVCILHNRSKLRLLRILMLPGRRDPSAYAGVRVYNCREVKLVLEEGLPFHADGESLGIQKEFSARCVKQKLKIIS